MIPRCLEFQDNGHFLPLETIRVIQPTSDSAGFFPPFFSFFFFFTRGATNTDVLHDTFIRRIEMYRFSTDEFKKQTQFSFFSFFLNKMIWTYRS